MMSESFGGSIYELGMAWRAEAQVRGIFLAVSSAKSRSSPQRQFPTNPILTPRPAETEFQGAALAINCNGHIP